MKEANEIKRIIDELKPLTNELYHSGLIKQPNYILPMVLSVCEALCAGARSLISIEFGVASGRGLTAMGKIAERLTKEVGVDIQVFGFDTFTGLPPLKDHRDHPEIWRGGQYAPPNLEKLKESVPSNCELVIGNIDETIEEFCQSKLGAESPIGFISVDLDFYSSTKNALTILAKTADFYLPSVLMYFDDIDGNLTLNRWCGEELAIDEFNNEHGERKIQRKVCNSPKMFCCHVLDHPIRLGLQQPLAPFELPVTLFQRRN